MYPSPRELIAVLHNHSRFGDPREPRLLRGNAPGTVDGQKLAAARLHHPGHEPEIPVHSGFLDHDLGRLDGSTPHRHCLCAPGEG